MQIKAELRCVTQLISFPRNIKEKCYRNKCVLLPKSSTLLIFYLSKNIARTEWKKSPKMFNNINIKSTPSTPKIKIGIPSDTFQFSICMCTFMPKTVYYTFNLQERKIFQKFLYLPSNKFPSFGRTQKL